MKSVPVVQVVQPVSARTARQNSVDFQDFLSQLTTILEQALPEVRDLEIVIEGSGSNVVVTVNDEEVQNEVIEGSDDLTVADLVNSINVTLVMTMMVRISWKNSRITMTSQR